MNKGIWRLPLYQAPLEANLDIRDIDTLKLIPQIYLGIRIAHAQDNMDLQLKFHDSKNGKKTEDYKQPDVHDRVNFARFQHEDD